MPVAVVQEPEYLYKVAPPIIFRPICSWESKALLPLSEYHCAALPDTCHQAAKPGHDARW